MKEQKVSKTAKAILARYFEKYIATEVQKEKIKQKRIYDNSIIEKIKRENYNNNIFINDNVNKNIINKKSTNLVVIDSDKWYKVIWNKIKRFFRK